MTYTIADPDAFMEKWKEDRLKKADEYVASRYAKLGDACASKGFPLQAKKGVLNS